MTLLVLFSTKSALRLSGHSVNTERRNNAGSFACDETKKMRNILQEINRFVIKSQ